MSQTGTCKFCNQTRIVRVEVAPCEDMTKEELQELYDSMATDLCNCEEATKERDKKKAQTASDEALEALTEPDYYLKDILAAARNQILMHPEFKGITLKVIDATSAEQRVYKLKTDKDDNVIATRTDTTSTADIVN
ncbi:MAG: hypothetical protein IKD59_09200 [Lachnospiraceae bacterium]|nr:hypothetical protein [Lachnospiraceae bacterium]